MITVPTNTFTLSLEAVAVVLGMIVSVTILLGSLIQFSNRITRIEHTIQYIKQELLEHSNADGHNMLTNRLSSNSTDIHKLEKALDLHILDYVNRKEFVQFTLGQLNEKIDHKFQRTGVAVGNIQRYLEKDSNYKIRDSLLDKEDD